MYYFEFSKVLIIKWSELLVQSTKIFVESKLTALFKVKSTVSIDITVLCTLGNVANLIFYKYLAALLL
jgi:hypothetical protein